MIEAEPTSALEAKATAAEAAAEVDMSGVIEASNPACLYAAAIVIGRIPRCLVARKPGPSNEAAVGKAGSVVEIPAGLCPSSDASRAVVSGAVPIASGRAIGESAVEKFGGPIAIGRTVTFDASSS